MAGIQNETTMRHICRDHDPPSKAGCWVFRRRKTSCFSRRIAFKLLLNMTKTQKVLALLADGPKTLDQIIEAYGLDRRVAQKILDNMQRAEYIRRPRFVWPPYVWITPKGVAHAEAKAKTNEAYLKQKARLKALDRIDAKKPRDADGVVRAARSVANSVFAMGAQ